MKEEKTITSFNTIVSCDVFKQDVMFHFGEVKPLAVKIEELLDADAAVDIVKVIRDDMKNNAIAMTGELGNATLVYLSLLPKDAEGYAILAHEIMHAAFMLAKKIGIECSSDSEEVYAYLIQFLTEKVLQEWEKYR